MPGRRDGATPAGAPVPTDETAPPAQKGAATVAAATLFPDAGETEVPASNVMGSDKGSVGALALPTRITDGPAGARQTPTRQEAVTPGTTASPVGGAQALAPVPESAPPAPADAEPLTAVSVPAPSTTPGLSGGAVAPPPAAAQQAAQQILAGLPQGPGGPLRDQPTEIALDPPELGRVRMVLSDAGGTLTLQITADRPETLDLMRRHAELLQQEFARAGLGDTSFSFAGRQGDGGEAGRDAPGESCEAPAADAAAPAPTDPPGAADGRLDLRL